jgi:predicted RNA binding protein YcfA (HicA-like mRNA interferase family)
VGRGGRQIGVLKYRELRRILERGGAVLRRQIGSHRIWAYRSAESDTEVSFTIPAHDDGADVRPRYIRLLRIAWKLDPEHGVSDEAFLESRWKRQA